MANSNFSVGLCDLCGSNGLVYKAINRLTKARIQLCWFCRERVRRKNATTQIQKEG